MFTSFAFSFNTASPPAGVTIDPQCFPHIFDLIIELGDVGTKYGLRSTCRAMRERIDNCLFAHVAITREQLQICVISPTEPYSRLPLLPFAFNRCHGLGPTPLLPTTPPRTHLDMEVLQQAGRPDSGRSLKRLGRRLEGKTKPSESRPHAVLHRPDVTLPLRPAQPTTAPEQPPEPPLSSRRESLPQWVMIAADRFKNTHTVDMLQRNIWWQIQRPLFASLVRVRSLGMSGKSALSPTEVRYLKLDRGFQPLRYLYLDCAGTKRRWIIHLVLGEGWQTAARLADELFGAAASHEHTTLVLHPVVPVDEDEEVEVGRVSTLLSLLPAQGGSTPTIVGLERCPREWFGLSSTTPFPKLVKKIERLTPRFSSEFITMRSGA